MRKEKKNAYYDYKDWAGKSTMGSAACCLIYRDKVEANYALGAPMRSDR